MHTVWLCAVTQTWAHWVLGSSARATVVRSLNTVDGEDLKPCLGSSVSHTFRPPRNTDMGPGHPLHHGRCHCGVTLVHLKGGNQPNLPSEPPPSTCLRPPTENGPHHDLV